MPEVSVCSSCYHCITNHPKQSDLGQYFFHSWFLWFGNKERTQKRWFFVSQCLGTQPRGLNGWRQINNCRLEPSEISSTHMSSSWYSLLAGTWAEPVGWNTCMWHHHVAIWASSQHGSWILKDPTEKIWWKLYHLLCPHLENLIRSFLSSKPTQNQRQGVWIPHLFFFF